MGSSGISWTICKQYAPRSRQIIMPTPHHSIFTRCMLFLTPNQQYQSTKGSQRHKTANEIMQQIQVKTNWSAIVYYCNHISVNTAHIKVKEFFDNLNSPEKYDLSDNYFKCGCISFLCTDVDRYIISTGVYDIFRVEFQY